MNPASVGFQCPSCVASGRGGARAPRTAFGAILKPGGGTATKVVMGVLAAEWLLSLVSGRLLDQLLVMSNEAVYLGQFWRLFTASLTSGTILGLLMNLLVLWIAGRAIESELGAWRFVALYLAAGLGGATMLFVFGPPGAGGYGAAAAVIGLLAANAIFKYKMREDVRADIGLFVLLILYSILIGFRELRLADVDRRHRRRRPGRIGAGVRAPAQSQHGSGRRVARSDHALSGRCLREVDGRLTK